MSRPKVHARCRRTLTGRCNRCGAAPSEMCPTDQVRELIGPNRWRDAKAIAGGLVLAVLVIGSVRASVYLLDYCVVTP